MDLTQLKYTMNTIKGVSNFSDAFQRFIKEEIGIKFIYPESKSYLKKKVSFEERQAKIELMLDKVKIDDDKLSPNEQALAQWSDEAIELNSYIKKLGLMPDICAEDYLLGFFETLYFQRLGIKQMDESLSKMTSLVVLNLSFNRITVLQTKLIPKNLKELYLSGNDISMVSAENQPSPHFNLVHLGLSYNKLSLQDLVSLQEVFPNLFCLDLSFNNVCNFIYTISTLKGFACLKMVYLQGNPVALTPRYRDIMKQNFETMKIIDGVPAYLDSESPSKRKKKAATLGLDKNIEIERSGMIDIQLRLLQNIDGIYLNEEQCKLEILDQLKENQKSSVFWLQYVNERNETVQTEKKIWIQHFQVDKESGLGKTDFGFKLRTSIELDEYTRDWMRRDLLVELWESRPVVKEKKMEDESVVKEVVMDEQNQPVIETRIRGVIKIDISEWVNRVELTKEDLHSHFKMHFFDAKFLKNPEFMFSNYYAKLKESDKQLLLDFLTQQEEQAAKLKQAQLEEVSKQQVAPGGKPGGKPDPKKDPKAAQAQKKGAVVEDKNAPKPITVDYPETPMGASFMIFENQFNQMREALIKSEKINGGKKGGTAVVKEQTQEEKKALRLKELQGQFQIVRGLQFSLAVKTRLNLPEEVEVKKEEPVVDPKKKK